MALEGLLHLLHNYLGVCCYCLDAEFWSARNSRPTDPSALPPPPPPPPGLRLLHPRPQALRDVQELLLPSPEPSVTSSIDGGSDERQLQRAASSSSEELYRAGSFNTKVHVLRAQSPFYRTQQPSPEPAAGIELKPAMTNVLLGQQHLEQRGKLPAAHPVALHPGSAVRRAASPQSQQHLGTG